MTRKDYSEPILNVREDISKTTDLAAMVTWVLFASRRRLQGYGAAADRNQARLLRDSIELSFYA